MTTKTLICFDFNGTLFSANDWVSANTCKSFLALIKKNPHWCIVTSMPPGSKNEIANQLESMVNKTAGETIDASSKIICSAGGSKGAAITNYITKHNLAIEKIIAYDDISSNLDDIKASCSKYEVETHTSL